MLIDQAPGHSLIRPKLFSLQEFLLKYIYIYKRIKQKVYQIHKRLGIELARIEGFYCIDAVVNYQCCYLTMQIQKF